MKIKAISLWQPWASLIAIGAKKYETRSWATSYRGPLLICAAKGGLPIIEVRAFLMRPEFYSALSQIIPKRGGIEVYPYLPFGQAVAIVDLTDCIRTELFKRGHPVFLRENIFGDFSSGRYAWKLENVRAVEPFPVRGRQGLFDVEVDPCILESTAV